MIFRFEINYCYKKWSAKKSSNSLFNYGKHTKQWNIICDGFFFYKITQGLMIMIVSLLAL